MIDEKILLQELDEMIKIQQKSVERAVCLITAVVFEEGVKKFDK